MPSKRRFKKKFKKKFFKRKFKNPFKRSFKKTFRKKRPKVSVQKINHLFPDVAITKTKTHLLALNVGAGDPNTILQNGESSNNTLTIIMNANPGGGDIMYVPGTTTPLDTFQNPNNALAGRYAVYRPTGCKVKVRVWTQDSDTQDAAHPFTLFGFPCARQSLPTVVGNQWDGTITAGFNSVSVPAMKYGWKRTASAYGSKNMVTYEKYYDFAKILGMTKEQYLYHSGGNFICSPDDNQTNPNIPIELVMGLTDYNTAVARQLTVDVDYEQYGRWEGQNLLYD